MRLCAERILRLSHLQEEAHRFTKELDSDPWRKNTEKDWDSVGLEKSNLLPNFLIVKMSCDLGRVLGE